MTPLRSTEWGSHDQENRTRLRKARDPRIVAVADEHSHGCILWAMIILFAW
jgi:hypothetical protein